ncbi:MAG: 2-hydroxychromene-2-carboxylate isomerase [Magnetospirillum sp.]|nr:2-hydroxychromene-2-carboxylate isomerase [Magnetospirillum sp.]
MEFWFDFSSPYAFFAAQDVDGLAARHGRSVTWRPFMLAAAFQVTGMSSFSRAPLRGDYGRHDWDRIARAKGIHFALPPFHPYNALHPARTFYWLAASHPDMAKDFALACFAAYFQDGADLRQPDVVADIAADQGAPRDQALAAMAAPQFKECFRQATEEALAKGVFGSPFFLVDGEPFWGWDRLPMVEEWLSGGGW